MSPHFMAESPFLSAHEHAYVGGHRTTCLSWELRTARGSASGLYQRGQGEGYPLVSTGFHFEGEGRFKVEIEVELAKFLGGSKRYRALLPTEHAGNAINASIRVS